MADGWIKLWRKAKENPWLQDAIQRAVFFTLLLDAETEPHERRHRHGITLVGRGQCLIAQNALAAELNVGRQQIRRALDNLKRGGLINPRTNHLFTLVTICNFERYQERPERDQPSHQPANQPRANQEPTRLQEGEEGEEGKKIRIISVHNGSATTVAPPDGGAVKAPRGTRLAENWHPSPRNIEDALKAGVPRDKIDEVAAEFVDHWIAQPGRQGVKTNWDATWRNRCRAVAPRYRQKQGSFSSRSGYRDPISGMWIET
jgi:hypothetical protein